MIPRANMPARTWTSATQNIKFHTLINQLDKNEPREMQMLKQEDIPLPDSVRIMNIHPVKSVL